MVLWLAWVLCLWAKERDRKEQLVHITAGIGAWRFLDFWTTNATVIGLQWKTNITTNGMVYEATPYTNTWPW